MPRFGSKKKITDYVYSKGAIFFLLVLAVYMSVSVYERYTVERQMSERRVEAEEDLLEIIERKEMLEEKVQYLEGERGIEEEIRKHFDVAKDGEQVIILLGEDEKPTEENVAVIKKKRWYQFWR